MTVFLLNLLSDILQVISHKAGAQLNSDYFYVDLKCNAAKKDTSIGQSSFANKFCFLPINRFYFRKVEYVFRYCHFIEPGRGPLFSANTIFHIRVFRRCHLRSVTDFPKTTNPKVACFEMGYYLFICTLDCLSQHGIIFYQQIRQPVFNYP